MTAGVRLNASLDILAVNGIIMILKITLAVKRSIPIGVPSNSTPTSGRLPMLL
jgi:hypothetical protein